MSRAKDFLSSPLLVIKRHGQYSVIGDISYCHYIFRHLNRFIRLFASHNHIKPNRKYLGWTKADHFFCIDGNRNYNHYPIRESILLNYDLTFMVDQANQVALKNIIDLFENKQTDELQAVYFRSMKFFANSVTGIEFSVDAISDQLLNLLISAETLLSFTTRGEKKSKLAHVMIGLAEVPEAEKSKSAKAVIETYIDRSSLMHAGKQEVSKYIIEMETNQRESESLIVLSKLMSTILINFPNWYNEITSQGLPKDFLLLWQGRIKRYLPIIKYNFFQRLVSRLIVFLQKISKVKTDL